MSKKADNKQVEEFLGVRILTPLEENGVAGGKPPVDQGNDHDHDTIFGDHHDHG